MLDVHSVAVLYERALLLAEEGFCAGLLVIRSPGRSLCCCLSCMNRALLVERIGSMVLEY